MGPVAIHPDPLPIRPPSKHQSGRLSKAKYLAGLDGLDLEMAFGIGLQLAIGLVVVDEGSHSTDVPHSFGGVPVDLDVGALSAGEDSLRGGSDSRAGIRAPADRSRSEAACPPRAVGRERVWCVCVKSLSPPPPTDIKPRIFRS
jgi:hypothetical protein